jgi:hypothetical protein
VVTGIAPIENGLYGGTRGAAIGRGWDGIVRDEVMERGQGLGGIEAVGIRAVVCVGIVAQWEDASAMG